jgi:hypothetical protein
MSFGQTSTKDYSGALKSYNIPSGSNTWSIGCNRIRFGSKEKNYVDHSYDPATHLATIDSKQPFIKLYTELWNEFKEVILAVEIGDIACGDYCYTKTSSCTLLATKLGELIITIEGNGYKLDPT